jgi:hypothetical protein
VKSLDHISTRANRDFRFWCVDGDPYPVIKWLSSKYRHKLRDRAVKPSKPLKKKGLR